MAIEKNNQPMISGGGGDDDGHGGEDGGGVGGWRSERAEARLARACTGTAAGGRSRDGPTKILGLHTYYYSRYIVPVPE